jgi:hypothetical protein
MLTLGPDPPRRAGGLVRRFARVVEEDGGMTRVLRLLLLAALALMPACGAGSSSPSPSARSPVAVETPDPAGRPPSPVTIRIVSPIPGDVVHGTTLRVAVALTGGTVVQATTTRIRPDQGHVHLYLDNTLVYMNYTLEQDVPVHLGENGSIRAEFVAADHFPFNPRVTTPDVFFSVKA